MSSYQVSINDKEYTVHVGPDGSVKVDGFDEPIQIEPIDNNVCSVLLGRKSIRIASVHQDGTYQVLMNNNLSDVRVTSERDRLLRRYASSTGDSHRRLEIHAPMPALVVRVEVQVGDQVRSGQGLLILEAMKMENEIKAHQSGRVKEVLVEKGATVEKGQLLMLLE
jgi:biotin carboxyl carrier protein